MDGPIGTVSEALVPSQQNETLYVRYALACLIVGLAVSLACQPFDQVLDQLR
jgi:hypothetical protein